MQVENGKTVSFHYVGTLNDGNEFDNSYTRGDPLTGTIGSGQLITGFESALMGMQEGEKKSVLIESEKAYGAHNSEAIQQVPLGFFPEGFVAILGETVQGQSEDGQVFNAKIVESSDEVITLDFNHPLAGEDLNFEIEVISVEEAA